MSEAHKVWCDKAWGKTREIIHSDFYSKHELLVETGGYCSLHYHHHRANRFVMVSGVVEIVELYGPQCVRTKIDAGAVHEVASLVPHMFIVWESGVMIEEYYSDRKGKVLRDDIVRLVEGGRAAPEALVTLPFSLYQGLYVSGQSAQNLVNSL